MSWKGRQQYFLQPTSHKYILQDLHQISKHYGSLIPPFFQSALFFSPLFSLHKSHSGAHNGTSYQLTPHEVNQLNITKAFLCFSQNGMLKSPTIITSHWPHSLTAESYTTHQQLKSQDIHINKQTYEKHVCNACNVNYAKIIKTA